MGIKSAFFMDAHDVLVLMITDAGFKTEVLDMVKLKKKALAQELMDNMKLADAFQQGEVCRFDGTVARVKTKVTVLSELEFAGRFGANPTTRNARYHPTMTVRKWNSIETEKVCVFVWEGTDSAYRTAKIEYNVDIRKRGIS